MVLEGSLLKFVESCRKTGRKAELVRRRRVRLAELPETFEHLKLQTILMHKMTRDAQYAQRVVDVSS